MQQRFTPEMIDAIYAAWHGAGVDILGGNWNRFVELLSTDGLAPFVQRAGRQPWWNGSCALKACAQGGCCASRCRFWHSPNGTLSLRGSATCGGAATSSETKPQGVTHRGR